MSDELETRRVFNVEDAPGVFSVS